VALTPPCCGTLRSQRGWEALVHKISPYFRFVLQSIVYINMQSIVIRIFLTATVLHDPKNMNSRTQRLFAVCAVVALGLVAMSTGQAAQPLMNNFICGNPLNGCSGGFQTRPDRDQGRVMLHFTVAPGTPDGTYGWSYTYDNNSGGGSYSVDVQNGVVTNGQDWVIWHTPDFFWGSHVIGIVTVSGSQHVRVVSPATTQGFYPVDGYHDCCCEYGCTTTVTYTDVIEMAIGETPPDENQTRECDLKAGCSACSKGMANYSIHLMLASLHIEDTPISYNAPRGPSTDFKVVYNQREANQPTNFAYSNLGPKWTFNWLSYVTDDGPGAAAVNPAVYVRGGGTEVYSGFNSGTQSYAPDRQTLAVLVRTSSTSYEKRFPNGSKEVFAESDGSTSYPRRVFLTSVVDAAGNSATLTYDGTFRLRTIADSLGQVTTLAYNHPSDPLKITKVTDPFGRFASFQYTSGQLTKITDPVGIESAFGYASGSDFINAMTTPYGTTTFAKGETGNSVRWLEATDPLGGKERVEYNEVAPLIPSSEASAPPGVHNNDLQLYNSFYWDKKAMADAPGDYTKAQIFHWLKTSDGKVSGTKHSEKKALESRIWYTYEDQTDPAKVGKNALPIKVARLVEGGANQLSQYSYNTVGNVLKETDPVGRVKSYAYDTNGIDVVTSYQRNPAGASLDPDGQPADQTAANTYNGLHQPLTATDAAGQTTTYVYNSSGQVLTIENAKGETTTYDYGDGTSVPLGYIASISSPQFNGVSTVTSFGYDSCKRVRTVTNEADQYTVTTDYDNLDRKTAVTYPDGTHEEFQYKQNFGQGTTTILDLTASRDRLGRWTNRHYNANRQMDSMTDPANRTTLYGWCTCGSLNSITDPNGSVTTFHRDLQGRVYQKVFADTSTVDYLFEGQTAPNTVGATSSLKSSTDALNRRTNFFYFIDDNLSEVSYTDTSGNQLSPPTPSVSFVYDPNHNRMETMNDGTGLTTYTYHAIPGLGAGKLQSIDGPLADDTISFIYDELGRTTERRVNGIMEAAAYDSLGRLAGTKIDSLGKISRTYDGVTPRLQTVNYPNGQTTNYTYFGNNNDRRLQTLENLGSGAMNLSKFDYTYEAEGGITSWTRLLEATNSGRWFEYDNARQLLSARDASDPNFVSEQRDYGYDAAGNRISDGVFNPFGQIPNGTFHSYHPNALNQIQSFNTSDGWLVGVDVYPIYDLAGNLTDDGEGKTFEWDAADRLIAINTRHTRSEFTYDGLSRRVKIVEASGGTVTSTKQFVWIGAQIAEERDANNEVTRRYYREGEERIGGQDAGLYYYTRDHLGSIRELTDASGMAQVSYDYDPYGKRTKLSGTHDVDFGYTGHYHHAPSDLNLTLYRGYNPALGRWLSRDPIGEQDGPNLYAYVHNDPLNTYDALGLQGITIPSGPPFPLPIVPNPTGSNPNTPGGALGGLGGLGGNVLHNLNKDLAIKQGLTACRATPWSPSKCRCCVVVIHGTRNGPWVNWKYGSGHVVDQICSAARLSDQKTAMVISGEFPVGEIFYFNY